MLTAYVQGRIFNYDYCVGGIALSGAGWFFPSDFAVGPNRSLYVLSKGYEFLPTQGITKCTLDSEYVWECRGGDYLEGRGPFPSSIALDSDENVYVSDEFKEPDIHLRQRREPRGRLGLGRLHQRQVHRHHSARPEHGGGRRRFRPVPEEGGGPETLPKTAN